MRGTITQRSKGSWRIRVELTRDPETGARRWRTETVKGDKSEAEARLNVLLVEAEANRGYVTSDKLTVGQYLERWLEAKREAVKPTTWRSYRVYLARWRPTLGDIPLTKLHPLDVQAALAKIAGSATTKKDSLITLRTSLRQAVKWRLIPTDPSVGVLSPEARGRELNVWNEEEVQRFLLVAQKETRLYVLFTMALNTGMRQGELLALRWTDIQDRVAVITRSLGWINGNSTPIFQEPKTRSGRRKVPFGVGMDQLLRERRKRQLEERLRAGGKWEHNDLIFCTQLGRPLHDSAVRDTLAMVIRKADLPPIRFHDLRHTHATLLLRQGINPKVVAERLGHASVGITLDTYSHILPDTQQEAVTAIANALNWNNHRG